MTFGRDAGAVDHNARERAIGAVSRIFLAREGLVPESMMNADGHSCRRLLGAPAGDEISDQLTHMPLDCPTLR
jgi:hypothetical protein